jgi:hypothetical protein
MSPRERFGAIMRGRRPDRLPLWNVEGISESAIRKWICQGHLPLGIRAEDVVAFDPHTQVRLDTDPLPAFGARTIAEDEQWRTVTDQYGFTLRASKTQSVGPTHYYYLAGSLAGRADWEKMKARFDPSDPRRLPREWSSEYFDQLNGSCGPVTLRIDWGPGRGIKNGYMLGTERFLETLTADPGLLEEMFAFWAEFVVALAGRWTEHVRFDLVWLNEDGMGFKNSTMVSPETYRRIWGPSVRKVIDFFRSAGAEVIGYHTSGNICPLISTLMDLGVNLLMPLEAAAGLDARQLRRPFGPELRLIGNISRQALMDGPDAVEREFRAKVPELTASGGYIPAVDDLIMPDMPYASLARYVELVRQFDPAG